MDRYRALAEELVELELVLVGLVLILAGKGDLFAGVVLVPAAIEYTLAGAVSRLAGTAGSLGRLAYAEMARVLAGEEDLFESSVPVEVVLVLVGAPGRVVGLEFEIAVLAFVLEELGLWLEFAVSSIPALDRHYSCQ